MDQADQTIDARGHRGFPGRVDRPRPRRQHTLNQTRAIVRGIFALAVERYDLEDDVSIAFKRAKTRRATSEKISFYPPEEVMRLVAHAANEQDAALFLTAAFTGLRASELRGLRWRSVDFAGSLLHVERGFTDEGGEDLPKSYRVRSVPLMPQVALALTGLRRREYFTDDDELVFVNEVGDVLGYDSLVRRYRTAQKHAGVRRLRFHDLRHSFGTMAVRQFPITDVQTWMGHADIATTRRVHPLRTPARGRRPPRRARQRTARPGLRAAPRQLTKRAPGDGSKQTPASSRGRHQGRRTTTRVLESGANVRAQDRSAADVDPVRRQTLGPAGNVLWQAASATARSAAHRSRCKSSTAPAQPDRAIRFSAVATRFARRRPIRQPLSLTAEILQRPYGPLPV